MRATSWAGLTCCITLMVALGVVFITHPRSETQYLSYLADYGNYDSRAVDNAPPEVLIAAGDRACSWLDHQQPALWRTGRSWRVDSLFRDYQRAISQGDASLPKSVVPGAWAYLCPASLYLRKPHYVFSDPSHD